MAPNSLAPQPPRELTAAEIEGLAERPGVNPATVRRFLRQLDLSLSRAEHIGRALSGSTFPVWGIATCGAILEGIDLAYVGQAPRCWKSRKR